MLIRRATDNDTKNLLTLLHRFNDYYFEEHIFTNAYNKFWEYKDKDKIFKETINEWMESQKYFVFVAEGNGQMIGYICGQMRAREPRVLDKEGYIVDWFVLKEWRGKGVGMRLYRQVVEEFKKLHCNRMGLLTNIGNKNTIAFYHKLGFLDESLTMVKELD